MKNVWNLIVKVTALGCFVVGAVCYFKGDYNNSTYSLLMCILLNQIGKDQ